MRRVLFVITDGEDNQSHITATETAKIAQREGVPVFALGLVAWGRKGGTILQKLAHETGGNAVVLDAPHEFLNKLLRPLSSQYFVTFTSSTIPQGTLRSLEVKSLDHSIKITAPAAYSAY